MSPLAPADTEIVYAYVVEDQKAAKDQARDTWNEALSAYQENDFETAQTYINETLVLDPDNANALALQSNLDVFSGSDGGTYDTVEEEAMSRKVRETAKAKVADKEVLENQLLEEADEYMARGDYEEAERRYAQAADISEDLAQYDQVESNESTYRSKTSRRKAEEARQAGQRTRREPAPVLEEVPDRFVVIEEPEEFEGPTGSVEGVAVLESGDYEVYFEDDDLMIAGDALDGAFMSDELTEHVGGLIGAKGTQVGSGALGTRGSGPGGGGEAEGLGGLSTKGRGSGASGYGSGGGSFGKAAPAMPAEKAEDGSFEPMEAYAPEPMPEDMAVAYEGAYDMDADPSVAAVPPPPPMDSRPKPAKPSAGLSPSKPQVSTGRVELSQLPDLAATTWGVPLPEHGQPVVLTQRLLAPGEAATVTLKYRETK